MFNRIISKRFSTLLIAETKGGLANPGNLNAMAAALKLSTPVDVLALGDGITAESLRNLQVKGIGKVFVSNNNEFKNPVADSYSNAIKAFIDSQGKYTHVITMTSSFSKDYFPRLSALYGCQAITDVTDIDSSDTFKRPVYAGNAIVTVKSKAQIKFISARTTNFDAVQGSKIESVEIKDGAELLKGSKKGTRFVSEKVVKSDRPDLNEAKIVVSGGRGLKNGENFKLLEDLADALGDAAIGASRAAVDAGYCANDMQIGQTGKIVAPNLYIAIGISGAIQHLAGMKDSKVIVAINTDAEAPIFQVANYGLVGDLFKIVPELTQKLQKA